MTVFAAHIVSTSDLLQLLAMFCLFSVSLSRLTARAGRTALGVRFSPARALLLTRSSPLRNLQFRDDSIFYDLLFVAKLLHRAVVGFPSLLVERLSKCDPELPCSACGRPGSVQFTFLRNVSLETL